MINKLTKNIFLATSIIVIYFMQLQSVSAEIFATQSLDSDEIKNLLKTIDSSSLVLINLEDTIIASRSKMFIYKDNPDRSFITHLLINAKENPFFNPAIKAWFENRKVDLVESSWLGFIEELKKTGALVLGFCEIDSKIYDLVKNPEDVYYKDLNKHGINFIDKVNNQQLIKLDNLSDRWSVFYKGIIFTGPFSKAQTLIDFMKITNIIPRKIIVFDNRIDQLNQIKYYLRTFDLDYYGVNYLAVAERTGTPDSKIIKFQQETLINEGKWLEDEEAESALKNKESLIH